ncbi:hypothetical protein [Symmachiella dynata]|uniref:hypothetical protein n=1 Tax=Symmachiella dynata TaxID=2527995 RepID=UPI0030ED7FCC
MKGKHSGISDYEKRIAFLRERWEVLETRYSSLADEQLEQHSLSTLKQIVWSPNLEHFLETLQKKRQMLLPLFQSFYSYRSSGVAEFNLLNQLPSQKLIRNDSWCSELDLEMSNYAEENNLHDPLIMVRQCDADTIGISQAFDRWDDTWSDESFVKDMLNVRCREAIWLRNREDSKRWRLFVKWLGPRVGADITLQELELIVESLLAWKSVPFRSEAGQLLDFHRMHVGFHLRRIQSINRAAPILKNEADRQAYIDRHVQKILDSDALCSVFNSLDESRFRQRMSQRLIESQHKQNEVHIQAGYTAGPLMGRGASFDLAKKDSGWEVVSYGTWVS